MLQRARESLFREPQQGVSNLIGLSLAWVLTLGGLVVIVGGLFFSDFSLIGKPSYNLPWTFFASRMFF